MTSNTTLYGVTSEEAIQVILASEGDLDLAAERMFGVLNYPGEGKARLTAILTEDPTAAHELRRILRTLTLLQAFSSFKEVAIAVSASLERMEPRAKAGLFNNLLNAITSLTDDHTQTVNSKSTSLNLSLTESILSSLPPQVRDAIKVLAVSDSDDPGPGAPPLPSPTETIEYGERPAGGE